MVGQQTETILPPWNPNVDERKPETKFSSGDFPSVVSSSPHPLPRSLRKKKKNAENVLTKLPSPRTDVSHEGWPQWYQFCMVPLMKVRELFYYLPEPYLTPVYHQYPPPAVPPDPWPLSKFTALGVRAWQWLSWRDPSRPFTLGVRRTLPCLKKSLRNRVDVKKVSVAT